MKHILILTSLLAIFASCKKDSNIYGVDCSANNAKAIQEEIDSIGRYLDLREAKGDTIDAILHPNGFYYVIKDVGEGDRRPETCSAINVDYIGRRYGDPYFSNIPSIEGTVFDEGNGVNLSLYNTIAGWQQAIPLLGLNGKIELYLPPSLAYGEKGSMSIAPNTYLLFEITLNSFN